jgi:hypothetical protein
VKNGNIFRNITRSIDDDLNVLVRKTVTAIERDLKEKLLEDIRRDLDMFKGNDIEEDVSKRFVASLADKLPNFTSELAGIYKTIPPATESGGDQDLEGISAQFANLNVE